MHLLFRDADEFVEVIRVTNDPNHGRAKGRQVAKIRKYDATVIAIDQSLGSEELEEINLRASKVMVADTVSDEECFWRLSEYARRALKYYRSIENTNSKLATQNDLGDVAAMIRRSIQ